MTFLLAIFGGLLLLRGVLFLFAAEMGRKQDLLRHVHKGGTDFKIAILIPYLDSRKIGPFQELIQALDAQNYPKENIGIHIIATEESTFALPNSQDLPENLKIWTYPENKTTQGKATSWLIGRLLAAGGPNKLFVFLNPDDIVRPDFLQNVTSRALDCFVMQGYTALKRPPLGFIDSLVALSIRLVNRIENAGRFHLGLSCRLQTSGWIARQEVLEMIPFELGNDVDNTEYSIRLNLHGYRINWAPNVVTYKEDRVDFTDLLKTISKTCINRVRLLGQYGIPLFVQGLTRMDGNAFEQLWEMIKPPHFVLGLIGVTGILASQAANSPTDFTIWALLTLGFWGLNLFSLAVARCNFKDVMYSILVTPMVYTLGLLLFPFMALSALFENLFKLDEKAQKARMGKRFDEKRPAKKPQIPQSSSATLFIEELEREHQEMQAAKSAASTLEPDANDFANLYSHYTQEAETPSINTPRHEVTTVTISNGKNSVNGTLHIHSNASSDGQESYNLVFEYKALSFKSKEYPTFDEAFEELSGILQSKGFSLSRPQLENV